MYVYSTIQSHQSVICCSTVSFVLFYFFLCRISPRSLVYSLRFVRVNPINPIAQQCGVIFGSLCGRQQLNLMSMLKRNVSLYETCVQTNRTSAGTQESERAWHCAQKQCGNHCKTVCFQHGHVFSERWCLSWKLHLKFNANAYHHIYFTIFYEIHCCASHSMDGVLVLRCSVADGFVVQAVYQLKVLPQCTRMHNIICLWSAQHNLPVP